MIRFACLGLIGLAVAACESNPTETEADVIVVGAGIAGLSAALEAGAAGVGVVVVEWSSVAGGHAVKAGGFALVDTPLQRNKGHADSPDLAFRDLMAWGENADADWVRQFVERSRAEVHDWLSGKGVRFNILIDTPEDSVPRFHFAGGTAVNVIVPLLREALTRDNIHWAMNSRAEELIAADDGVIVVRVRDSRTGDARLISAAAVVLATGGFQSNPDLVRRYWPATIDRPDKLLIGAGHRATGDGLRVGRSFGAAVTRIDDQVTFINGLPNPREPTRGLHVTNPASIWVNARGDRFVNERDTTRVTEAAVLGMSPQTHWMIFDARGRRKLQIRGAEWLNRRSIVTEILDNPRVAARAESIAELAAEAGLPPDRLRATVERYNDFIAAGRDEDFRRFGDADPITDSALQSSPYYALQLWPMTRKNLGGLAIDLEARALGAGGAPVPGLFAAGEVTGVAGINGRHGGSGTFLAPSVLMGRIAGRSAAEYAANMNTRATGFGAPSSQAVAPLPAAALDAAGLAGLVGLDREGYWHFEKSHAVVLEREYACSRCHADQPANASATAARLARLDGCTACH